MWSLLCYSHCGVLLILQAEEADDLEVTTDAATEDITEAAQVCRCCSHQLLPWLSKLYTKLVISTCCVVQEAAAVTDNQEHFGGDEDDEEEDVDVELQRLAEVSSTVLVGAW